MVLCSKKQKHCQPDDLWLGDCWIGITIAAPSGLILSARVGKHTDQFLAELFFNTEGQTDCQQWATDAWGGYERILSEEVKHLIGKDKTQQERTYQRNYSTTNSSMASSSK